MLSQPQRDGCEVGGKGAIRLGMGFRKVAIGAVATLFTCGLASCSSSQQTAASDSVKQVDAACAKVRELNNQVDALNLDDKTSKALDDPNTVELLQKAADATPDLSNKVNEAATQNQGRLGKLKATFDNNRELISEVSDFAATESKDSLRDKARQLRKVADIVGADACAGTPST
jgi:outer membrane murein-binding lipoprotein Lpp